MRTLLIVLCLCCLPSAAHAADASPAQAFTQVLSEIQTATPQPASTLIGSWQAVEYRWRVQAVKGREATPPKALEQSGGLGVDRLSYIFADNGIAGLGPLRVPVAYWYQGGRLIIENVPEAEAWRVRVKGDEME
ncbi:MAG: hypothetical protein AB8H79_22380 [Myxococcota bacterium]